jgi:hypothetical protein
MGGCKGQGRASNIEQPFVDFVVTRQTKCIYIGDVGERADIIVDTPLRWRT